MSEVKPVAWMSPDGDLLNARYANGPVAEAQGWKPLYEHPPSAQAAAEAGEVTEAMVEAAAARYSVALLAGCTGRKAMLRAIQAALKAQG